MAYRKSVPLERWLDQRRSALDIIAQAHQHVGAVQGPGPPLALSRPLGHAFILRAVAEFQGFARDLYDLTVSELLRAAQPSNLQGLLTRTMTRGRSMDAQNATITALRTDFARLGLRDLDIKMAEVYAAWDKSNGADYKYFNALLRVRNALAHGNDRQVAELRSQGHLDTLTWGKARVPMLTRGARALDKVVWHDLVGEDRRSAMVRTTPRPLKVGDRVLVPWGVDEDKHGVVVDVWGDPPVNVRVEVEVEEDEQPELLLLNAAVLTRDEAA